MWKWLIGAVAVALLGCSGPSGSDGGTGGGAGGGAGGGGGATYQTPLSPAVKAFGHALVESGGKFYAAGAGSWVDGGAGGADVMLARFDATGARDTTFGTDGVVLLDTGGDGGVPGLPFNFDEARAVLVDGDTVLVVGTGRGPAVGPVGRSFVLARFLVDGGADTTFGTSGRSIFTVSGNRESVWNDVAKLPSGKYLVAGTIANGATRGNDFVLARYNLDGSIDATFTAGSGAGAIDDFGSTDEQGFSLVLQGDKPVVGGGSGFTVVRHLADGPLDLSFGLNGAYQGGSGYLVKVLARADGKLLLVGIHSVSSGGNTQNNVKLQLITADGQLDVTFGLAGTVEVPILAGIPRGAMLAADGKLWVYLGASLGASTVARFNVDGTLDTTFGTNGLTPAGPVLPLLQPIFSTPANRLVLVGGQPWLADLTQFTVNSAIQTVFYLAPVP